MGFFSRIMAAFSGKAPTGSDRYLSIYAIDYRCRELITGQVDLLNEVSVQTDEEGGGYYVRKVLHTAGKGRCFGQIEIEVWLDGKKQVTRHEVQGGRWLTADEYAAEVERRAAEELAQEEARNQEIAASADETKEN